MMLAAGLGVSSALSVGAAPKMSTTSMRAAAPQMATIGATLSSMDGPDIYWGEQGPLQNPPLEESDFKEYDKYSTFVSACQALSLIHI